MKILYGITKSNFGGAQRYVFDLATEVKKQGHEVFVLCGKGGTLVKKLGEENIKAIEIPSLGRDISIFDDITSFFSIYKILRKEKPGVFHINSSKMGGIGALAGRLAGIKKIIFTSHGWAFNENRSWIEKFIIKFLYWIILVLSHKTICVSEETRRQISKLPFVKNKLLVVHNGITQFSMLPTQPREILIVGALGELHNIKGFDILLKAWGKFVQKHGAKLQILGEGEERKKLEKLADELGVSRLVEFKGYVDNARAELLNFDIFVMPSRSENLPYAILEAGFAGLPVIASKVGGIPEIIENGVSGILVPKEDPETLLSSLILLAEDPELRKRLGGQLQKTIQQEFSLEKMVHDTLNVYV